MKEFYGFKKNDILVIKDKDNNIFLDIIKNLTKTHIYTSTLIFDYKDFSSTIKEDVELGKKPPFYIQKIFEKENEIYVEKFLYILSEKSGSHFVADKINIKENMNYMNAKYSCLLKK